MEWISAKIASEKWDVHVRRVQEYCASGKIPGAKRMGKQWVIPADASRPNDGRTRQGKMQKKTYLYHFPLFTHSPLYAQSEVLTEDEKTLLEAQILYLKGDFSHSMEICRKLEKESEQVAVCFGAVITLAFNALILGLYDFLLASFDRAKILAKQDSQHAEDYRLLIADLHYHNSLDYKPLLDIDNTKLSQESLYYYQSAILRISILTASVETLQGLKIYEAICNQVTADGIPAIALSLHFQLATIGIRQGLPIDIESHLKMGCSIARKNELDFYLAKHYFLSPRRIEEHLNSRWMERIKRLIPLFVDSSKIIQNHANIKVILDSVHVGYFELQHLLMHNLSNQDIATILDKSVDEIRRHIVELCDTLQLPDRDALIQYSIKQFNKSSAND